ncbi:M9 family metallopeptidase [Dokdonella fugitiva]|uniref:M9 family metallopeptidase n=1 Tax=Dokdonella fugitiva TaxID=328517 RepID=UPI0015FDA20C|nr:M9 family metallopeptidase [Dokdonella fugitiva]MBA8885526.1 microbial collagenase [Dokdonella fugitiva]
MSPFHRLLQASAASALCLWCAIAQAGADRNAALPPQGSPLADARAPHVQARRIDAGHVAPIHPLREQRYVDYDTGAFDRRAPLGEPSRRAAGGGCPDYANLGGAALVGAVKASDLAGCLYPLFDLTGTVAGQTFGEAKMVTIANAILADAPAYPGDNGARMLQLIMFLRAGYYVQWNDPAAVGAYGTALANAIRPALDAFVANPHFADVDEDHGAVLAEFVTLIDSAGENAHQLQTGALQGILERYDGPAMASMYWMKAATFNVFNVLFRGHGNDDFRAWVVTQAGSAITATLQGFIADNKASDVGTDREYLLVDAGMELARFLQYPNASGGFQFHDALHPRVKYVLDEFPLASSASPGAAIYVNTASTADWFDHAHCSYFGTCDLAGTIEPIILPPANARECSPTLKVRSQALTSQQLDWVCNRVGAEETYFHDTLPGQTDTPVPDDHNTQLEMVIFHSSGDYGTYSGVLFGNDTNNGGIYLEGDPSDPSNQPRFLCYEAEWLRPTFDVWNLTHEYIHYLDGRYNWWGGFGDLPQAVPASAIWYVEGFAEYVSYTFRGLVYGNALADAQGTPDRWALSQLFDTEYSTDYDRTYAWGYMAVRYMFERHPDDITTLYATVSRPVDAYAGYRPWLDAFRTAYDADFRAWIDCYATHDGDTSSCGGAPTDAIFASGFDGAPSQPPTECPIVGGSDQTLGNGCIRSGIAQANPGWYRYYALAVPAGASNLVVTTSGGSGNADLFVSAGNWPSSSDYDVASTQPGNEESVSVATPTAGWYYIALQATQPFSDVVLRAQYDTH